MLTMSQMVAGTPAYMAPEQRDGKPCDARTDIYAAGLILFEMASGFRPGSGQPKMEELPERFAHVVQRCLEQNPEDRWQSAADLARELQWSGQPEKAVASLPSSGSAVRRIIIAAA